MTSRTPHRSRRGVLLVLVMLALTTVSGCAGLPTTSLVATGKAINAQPDNEPLAVEPLSAASYDDPRQIATGFIRAQMSSHDDYATARTYLAPEVAKRWRPSQSVTIFDGSSDITATRPDTHTVRLGVPVVGSISPDGHLVHTAQATRRTVEFHVVDGAQGWRIDRLTSDDGVWISDSDVSRLYAQKVVYYPPAVGTALVPDVRWLPRQGLATALARAALTPPPAWLEPAVTSSLPAGTQLAVDAVPVRQGTAEVSLSPAAARADASTRARLWAALTATLTQAPEVNAVTLRVGTSRLEADNLPASVTTPDQVGYTIASSPVSAVISRSGPYLAWTEANAVDAVTGTDAKISAGRPKLPAVPADWTLVTAGQGGRQIAAVSPDRTSVRRWLNGTEVTSKDVGADLQRPTFDGSGWLWVAGRTHARKSAADASPDEETTTPGAGALWALDTSGGANGGAPSPISVAWLGSGSIESVSISPEGARAALTIVDGGRRRAVIAAVRRDPQGKPIALGPEHDAALGVSDVHDAVWADGTSLALLGSFGGVTQPVLQTIDDAVTPLGPVAGATELTSTANGASGLFVRTKNGSVYCRLGSSWSSFLTRGDLFVPRS